MLRPTDAGVCIQHEPQDHLPRMTQNPPGHLYQFPADGRDGLGSHAVGHASRVKPMNRLYASPPILKKTALA